MQTDTNFEAQLDRCVKCGLCLPECPTWQLHREEAESPRGRVSLMQALAAQPGLASPGLVQHLDQCLGCRRCEAVCPAGVRFGPLLDSARAELVRRGHGPGWRERLLAWLADQPRLLKWLAAGGQFLKRQLRFRIPGLQPLLDQLPDHPPAAAVANDPLQPGTAATRGKVSLFRGCMAELLEPGLVEHGARLLSAAGYEVSVPQRQRCCGALAAHAGLAEQAHRLQQHNIEVFAAADYVGFTATGCGAMLRDYDIDPEAAALAKRAHAVCYLLEAGGWRPSARYAATVAVFQPCSQRNVVGEHDATLRLLAAIPEVRLTEIGSGCCGAAGAHVIKYPAAARQLRQPLLDDIAGLDPAVVVTSNVGCAGHLRAGLRTMGLTIPVMHPVALLAELEQGGGAGL